MNNRENIQKLKRKVIENNGVLPYINLDSNGKYAGWVKDFHIVNKETGISMSLDLHEEQDLFVLFAMASCWSRPGQWENSACFAVYLKMAKKDDYSLWLNPSFVEIEKANRKASTQNVLDAYSMVKPGKKVSFRSDFYDSMYVLAKNWKNILSALELAEENNDFLSFAYYMSQIQGLSYGNKTMKIKIPLLLRELRIQKIYNNIPGELCCVPDERVKSAAKDSAFNLKLKYGATLDIVLENSNRIYQEFGDLYDIVLFAYDDLKSNW